MNTAVLILFGVLALIGVLVGALIYFSKKGEAHGAQKVALSVAAQENAIDKERAKIDALPIDQKQAANLLAELARRRRAHE